MLRVLTIAGGFLVITIALLALQPGAAPSDTYVRAPQAEAPKRTPVNQVQVSRADSGVDLVSILGSNSGAASHPDPLATTGTQRRPTPPAANDNNEEIASLSAGVLAGLAPSPFTARLHTPAEPAEPDALREMTAGVLASLNAARTPSQPAQLQTLDALIARAVRQGQSDAYLDALLNEAAATGQIAVPDALQTDTGRLDTATLLATLVRKSPPATGDAMILPEALIGDNGVEVRVVQRAGETVHYNFYTVQNGDSLGAIAHRFYGDARLFTTIFEANRTFLSSPNAIRPGQRLNIPNQGSS